MGLPLSASHNRARAHRQGDAGALSRGRGLRDRAQSGDAGIIVVIGTFTVAAEPPSRANEAAGEAKTTKNAKATFAQVFDIGKIHYNSLEPEMRVTDEGSQSADIIYLNFIILLNLGLARIIFVSGQRELRETLLDL
jgi:hypothetical protein